MEMMGVSVKECSNDGLDVLHGASVKATQCEFSENGELGVDLEEESKVFYRLCGGHKDKGTLVELCGEQMEIHHNGNSGFYVRSNATIIIYIPSHPIIALLHDNRVGTDLYYYYVHGQRWQNSIHNSHRHHWN